MNSNIDLILIGRDVIALTLNTSKLIALQYIPYNRFQIDHSNAAS